MEGRDKNRCLSVIVKILGGGRKKESFRVVVVHLKVYGSDSKS